MCAFIGGIGVHKLDFMPIDDDLLDCGLLKNLNGSRARVQGRACHATVTEEFEWTAKMVSAAGFSKQKHYRMSGQKRPAYIGVNIVSGSHDSMRPMKQRRAAFGSRNQLFSQGNVKRKVIALANRSNSRHSLRS